MTVAIADRPLFVFTVPVHRAAPFMVQNGYYEEELRGGTYYVTKDDRGKAVVGPKRHRGSVLFGRKKRAAGTPEPEPTPTPHPLQQAMDEVARNFRVQPIPGFSPLPPPRRRFARVRDWFANWRDPEWHENAQHTAKTVRMWAFTLFSLAIFVKGLLWILPM